MDLLANPGFEQVAASWAGWMVAMSWQVALLAMIVWLLTQLLHRASAAFRYALWGLVLLKLVIPPGISTPWSLGNLAHYAPNVSVDFALSEDESDRLPARRGSAETSGQDTWRGQETGHSEEIWKGEHTREPDAAASTGSGETFGQDTWRGQETGHEASWEGERTREPGLRWKWHIAMMLMWASVAFGMFAVIVFRAVSYHRHIARDLELLDPALQVVVEEQAARLGLGHRFDVRVSPHLSIPTVCLLRRPTVLIPDRLAYEISREQFADLMGHELAHVKRRDLQLGWVATLLLCLYWFHPAVWMAVANLRREREMACDDEVLYTSRPETKEYAATILRVAESFDGSMPAGSGFLGLFEVGEHLLQRIRSISDATRPRRAGSKSIVAVIAAAVLLVPMGVWTSSTSAQEPTQQFTIEQEIAEHYVNADPDVKDFVRQTAARFRAEGLWLPAETFAQLAPEEREAKVEQVKKALEGPTALEEYVVLAEAGALADPSFIPGLTKIAWHMEEGGQDNRSKWMAVAALGRVGDKEAVPTLIPLVDHYNQNTRMWARASLVRLTGENFGADKQAWADWANATGPETAIAPATLEWASRQSEEKMAAQQIERKQQATSATAGPATTPTPPEAVANVPKTADDVPGKVLFKAKYIHKSRGSQLPDPSTVWIKVPEEDPTEGAAICEFPAMEATFIALYDSPQFTRYIQHSRRGGTPWSSVTALGDDSVAVHYMGGEKNGQTETYTIPKGAIFDPNTRPDPYVASFMLQEIYDNAKRQEFTVYDWDNSGKGMASYNIRVENKGEETVVVPAGVFKADHIVQIQTSFGDTWYKKRPGHVTEYWVDKDSIILRILRHREPYEVLLASVEVGAQFLNPVEGEEAEQARAAQEAAEAATPQGQLEAAANEEIEAHYQAADEETKEYIRWTAGTFGPGHLWQPAGAFASLNPEEYRQKVEQMVAVLDGEYGRHLCEILADAGAFKHPLLLPGLTKHATYHREDSDYDCRPKWMAVSALGRQDDVSVVPTLIPLVDHGNQNTRMWARASLARLTGQWFGDDKQAWAKWWNDSDHEPKIDLDALKPWSPPPQAAAETPQPQATVTPSNLEIVSARYGAGETWVDVTEQLRQRMVNDTLDIVASNELAGDPMYGMKKQLEVHYRINGVDRTATVAELETLRIPQTGSEPTAATGQERAAPEIVSVTPEIGATAVDPATTEIRVTFDQDMSTGGFSWTGGGEVYPEVTARPFWADARTCVLPVKLIPAKFYRVGINSKSHKNFRSANGVPARNRVLYFATEGLPKEDLDTLMPPNVISLEPPNGATDVSPTIRELKVTFDKPMVGGFSWVQLNDQYPEGTGAAAWSENNTVCTRPVSLKANTHYTLSLNSARHINFQSAAGLPLEPVVWEFTTAE